MSNLTELTQELSAGLQAILDELGARLPEAGRQRIAEAKQRTDELWQILYDLDREVVSLERTPAKPAVTGRAYWEALKPGIFRERSSELHALRERSETLAELYRAGIDITQIIKLTEAELNISRRIGDGFGKFAPTWDRFKFAISKNQPEIESRMSWLEEAAAFFQILQDTRVVRSFTTALYAFRDKTWKDLPLKKLRHMQTANNNPLKIRFDFDVDYRGLITGHWFNGYVYDAMRDQLERLGVDYELYPLVSYTSRVNAALTRGEFDLLGRIHDQRFVVECKSGRIAGESRDGFADLLATSEALSQIFARTRLAQGLFILIYNPFLTEMSEVEQRLGGSEVRAIPIDDMRGRIIDLVNEFSEKTSAGDQAAHIFAPT